MATFQGTSGIDTANATTGVLSGFVTGTLAQLQDNLDDTFICQADNDTVIAGAGSDGIDGGDGNDLLFGNAGNDILIGRDGQDTMNGGLGNDVFRYIGDDRGVDTIDGGNDFDTIDFQSFGSAVTVNLESGADAEVKFLGVFGGIPFWADLAHILGNSIEQVNGSAQADTIIGNALANRLFGANGNDVLRGGGGGDRLTGGADNDDIIWEGGDIGGLDEVTGGSEVDRLVFATFNFAVRVDLRSTAAVEVQYLSAGVWQDLAQLLDETTEAVHGSIFGDTITGNAGGNSLNGYLGDDTLEGGAGGDVLFGNEGIDRASYAGASARVKAALDGSFAGEGDALGDVFVSIERLTGSKFGDVLRGNDEANRILGGAGNDTLQGMQGNDTIGGGVGADALTGGIGNDAFEYTALVHLGDTIKDFHNLAGDNDVLRFTGSVFGGLPAGALAANRFAANTTGAATTTDQRFIYETDTGILRWDADGSGASTAITIATLVAIPVLTAADFQII